MHVVDPDPGVVAQVFSEVEDEHVKALSVEIVIFSP